MGNAETKNNLRLIYFAIVLFILLFGHIQLFITATGTFLYLELAGFFVLFILALLGFITYKKNAGQYYFLSLFSLYLINLILVWLFYKQFYVVLVLLALIGFFVALPFPQAQKKEKIEEPHSVIFDSEKESRDAAKTVAAATSPATSSKVTSSKVISKHSPGKYVASKQSNVYHEPKCDWAKKIRQTRQVWFNSKEDAWEKGYKGHSCVN